jgi:dephospho-CoA kinase
MLRAEYGGCGKSYICRYMEKLGYEIIFICPTNRLCQNYKEHGITLNKFFSIGIR